jgi:ACS family glucarate transporter-like MFS transporter
MQILTDRDLLPVTFSYFAYGYAAYIFFSWFFVYLNQVRGLNLRESAWYSMMPFMAMAVGSLLGGWWSDLLSKARGKRLGRCGMAVIGMGLAAIFIAAGTQVASAKVASIVLAAGAGALYLSQSSFWSVSADIGKRSAGSVSGVMNMGGQFGGALTASLTPYIGSHVGWNPSFLVAAGLCALGAVAWLVVHPEGRRRDQEPAHIASTESLSR